MLNHAIASLLRQSALRRHAARKLIGRTTGQNQARGVSGDAERREHPKDLVLRFPLAARDLETKMMKSAPIIKGSFGESQRKHLELAIANVTLGGNWAEFGVWKGSTAKILLKHLPENNELFLFDSFKGLPEDWKEGFPQGTFSLADPEKPMFADPRAKIVQGYFEDTLPVWAKSHSDPLSLVFIDCDLYSSTRTIFHNIHHLIVPGTVIVFDEYYVPELDWDEMIAFLEFSSKHRVHYKYLTRAQNGSVSVVIS